MNDEKKTIAQLTKELKLLRKEVSELRKNEATRSQTEAEEKYQRLYETTTRGIVYQDANGKILSANPAAEQILGLTLDQMKGRTSMAPRWRAIHEDGSDFPGETHPAMVALKTGKKMQNIVMGVFNPKREAYGWISINAMPLFKTGENKPYSVYTTFEDITERREVEALATRLGRILENSLNEIYLFDAETLKFITVNRGARENLGYSIEELQRLTPLDLKQEFSQETFQKLIEPLRTGAKEVIRFTTVHRRKDGSLYDVEVHLQLSTSQNSSVFVAIILDITDRKKAEQALFEKEERYRTLFDLSPGGIILEDKEGKIIDVNPAFCKSIGYGRDDIIGKKVHMFTHPDVIHMVPINIKRLLDGEQLKHVEKSVRKDGTLCYMELHEKKIFLPDGDIGIVCIAENITARKKLEEEQLKRQKLESLGVLAGGIAHDFNNLITGVLGNISLAKMNFEPDDEVYEILTAAEKASSRTKDLTQQLLTFSKGGKPIKKTMSIADLIKDAAAFAVRGSNGKCRFSIPAGLWSVNVDEGQISQVIHNLVINAVHAMPHGGVIDVDCENCFLGTDDGLPLKKGQYTKISIKDRGTGIPEPLLQRIFDPYFTTKQKGSGLGLATAYSIIANHGGHISVDSELGMGAAFFVYLPASTNEKKQRQPKKMPVEFVGTGKVLVMEDEPLVRAVAGRMLSRIGFEVEFAEHGAQAIELYQKAKNANQPFAATLMDLTIPVGMGGKETIEKLLRIDPDIKAIVSSGYANDPIMSNYKKYGFCAVMVKPYQVSEMRAVFRSILGNGTNPQ